MNKEESIDNSLLAKEVPENKGEKDTPKAQADKNEVSDDKQKTELPTYDEQKSQSETKLPEETKVDSNLSKDPNQSKLPKDDVKSNFGLYPENIGKHNFNKNELRSPLYWVCRVML